MLPPLSPPQARCHNLKAFDLIILIFFVIIVITSIIIIVIIYIDSISFPPSFDKPYNLEAFLFSTSVINIFMINCVTVGGSNGWGEASLVWKGHLSSLHLPFYNIWLPALCPALSGGLERTACQCIHNISQTNIQGKQILEIMMEISHDTLTTRRTKLTKHPVSSLHQTYHHQYYFQHHHRDQIGQDLGDRKWLCWLCQPGHRFQSTPAKHSLLFFLWLHF